MGRKQHQGDKLYITTTEWKNEWGGKKVARGLNDPDQQDFRRLPFDHCALSLQPYETPYADLDGNVFELAQIVKFIKKFKVNPVTGKKLAAADLVKLAVHKDSKGSQHCPVMFKVFNNNSHIACVRTTGNVFCYEAVEELNIKTKNYKDLLTDEPFQRKDIIVLQDPRNTSKFNMNNFHHIKMKLRIDDDDIVRARTDPRARLKRINAETTETLKELDATYKAPEKKKDVSVKADKFNAATFSQGQVSMSLTSTAFARVTEHEAAVLEEDFVRYAKIKKKAYVRFVTNVGPLNIELHSEYVPKTCENFVKLCQKGYYDGTKFHRSIRHFMVSSFSRRALCKVVHAVWNI
jgi:peptidyl-prolyl cis-trans isomerase-like protein 2